MAQQSFSVINSTSLQGFGGVIYVNAALMVWIQNATFFRTKCLETLNGTVIYSTSPNTFLRVQSSDFSQTSADPGTTIYQAGPWTQLQNTEVISQAEQEQKSINGNLFTLLNNNFLSLIQNTFRNLYYSKHSSVAFIVDGQIEMYSNQFQDVYSLFGSAIYCIRCKSISSTRDTFNNCGAYQYGGIIFSVLSQGPISLYYSKFFNIIATYYGGVLAVIQSNSMFVDQCAETRSLTLQGIQSENVTVQAFYGGFLYLFDGTFNVNVYDSVFKKNYCNNQGGSFYLKGAQNLLIQNSVFVNSQSNAEGKIIYMTRGLLVYCSIDKIQLYNNVFDYDKVVSTTASSTFYLEFFEIIESNNNTLLGITTTGFSAGYNINSGGYFVDTNSVYKDLYASTVAVYHFDFINQVSLTNVTAENITCLNGACFMRTQGQIFGAINIDNITIDSSTQKSIPTARQGGAGFYISHYLFDSESNLTIKNSVFKNLQSDSFGGFMYINTQSLFPLNLKLHNNHFENVTAQQGGLIYVQYSILVKIYMDFESSNSIQNFSNTFYNVTATYEGGIIYSANPATRILVNSIYYLGSSIKLQTLSQIKNYYNDQSTQRGSFYLQDITEDVTIQNSIFEYIQDVSSGAVGVIISSTINDFNNTFKNNYAIQGGVYFIRDSVFITNKSTYLNNRANQGGVFAFDNNVNITISDCNIQGNEVSLSGGVISVFKSSLVTVIQNINVQGKRQIISNNSALTGGFVSLNSPNANMTFKDQTVSFSKASESGGVIEILQGQEVHLINTTIEYPQSKIGGFLISQNSKINFYMTNSKIICFNRDSLYEQEYQERGSFFHVFNAALIQFSKNLFRYCSSTEDGGLMNLRLSLFRDYNSQFQQIQGPLGAVIQAQSSKIYLTNSFFTQNSGKQGGALLISQSSELIVESSIFTYNQVYSQGGAISSIGNSSLQINNSKFLDNYSQSDSSVLDILSSREFENSTIRNSVFQTNSAYKNTISIMYSNVIIENCKFISNEAKVRSKNIFIGFSNVTIAGSQFTQTNYQQLLISSSIVGTFIYTIFDVNLLIYDSSFSNGIAQQGGAIYIYGDCQIKIGTCTFVNNKAYLEGGSIYGSGFTLLKIENKTTFLNSFANDEGDDIYISSTQKQFIMQNTSIKNSVGKNSVSIQQAQVTLIGVSFSDINKIDDSVSGSALKCINCFSLSIVNSFFKNLSSLTGGAIYLSEQELNKQSSSSFRYQITNSSFSNVESLAGGAIFIDNVQSLQISNSNFTKASSIQQEISDSSIQTGSGGAIYFTCNSLSQNCKLDVSQGNIFISNYAQVQGGAIYWDVIEPIFSTQRSNFSLNVANFYGSDIACFGQQLVKISQEKYQSQIQLAQGQTQDNRILNSDQVINQQLNDSYFLYQSQRSGGSLPSTYIALIDKYGQIVGSDSSGTIQVFVNSTYNTAEKANEYPPVLQGTNLFTLQGGVFLLKDVVFDGTPGHNYSIILQCSSLDQSKPSNKEFIKQKGKASMNLDLLIELRYCILGEQFTVDGKCEVCENSFSLQVQSSPGNCIPCPTSQAICIDGYLIYPLPGFWRKSNTSTTIIACLYPLACLGSSTNQDSPLGNCAEGYQGIICADCLPGFSRTGSFQCSKCPEDGVNILRLFFIGIIIFGIFGFLIRQTLMTASDQDSILNIFFKIMINHFQLLLMTSTFDINWSQQIAQFFADTNQVATVSSQIFSVDCFLNQRIGKTSHNGSSYEYESDDTSKMRIFFLKMILFAFFPLMLIVGCYLAWQIIRKFIRHKIDVKGRTISSVVIALFLAHSSIVQFMFYTFKCKKIDNEQRVLNDLEVICWDQQHTIYSMFVALPSIIVWGLGIPFFGLSLMIKARKQLNSVSVRERFGFLYRGYKRQYFYWEIVIIYRKVLIIFIAIFVKSVGIIAQTLVVILVIVMQELFIQLFSFLLLNAETMPFVKKSLNILEFVSLLAQMITLYLGIFFLVNKPQHWIDDNPEYADGAIALSSEIMKLFFAIIILSNCLFFIGWLIAISIELHQRLILKYTKIYLRFFLCNDQTKLPSIVAQRQKELDNQNLRERLQDLTSRILNMHSEGKFDLNNQSITRLEKFLGEGTILKAAGQFIGVKGKLDGESRKIRDKRRGYSQKQTGSNMSGKKDLINNINQSMNSISDDASNVYSKQQFESSSIMKLIEKEERARKMVIGRQMNVYKKNLRKINTKPNRLINHGSIEITHLDLPQEEQLQQSLDFQPQRFQSMLIDERLGIIKGLRSSYNDSSSKEPESSSKVMKNKSIPLVESILEENEDKNQYGSSPRMNENETSRHDQLDLEATFEQLLLKSTLRNNNSDKRSRDANPHQSQNTDDEELENKSSQLKKQDLKFIHKLDDLQTDFDKILTSHQGKDDFEIVKCAGNSKGKKKKTYLGPNNRTQKQKRQKLYVRDNKISNISLQEMEHKIKEIAESFYFSQQIPNRNLDSEANEQRQNSNPLERVFYPKIVSMKSENLKFNEEKSLVFIPVQQDNQQESQEENKQINFEFNSQIQTINEKDTQALQQIDLDNDQNIFQADQNVAIVEGSDIMMELQENIPEQNNNFSGQEDAPIGLAKEDSQDTLKPRLSKLTVANPNSSNYGAPSSRLNSTRDVAKPNLQTPRNLNLYGNMVINNNNNKNI